MPQQRVKVAQFGLGPIGIESIKLAAEKDWIEVVGGIDIDPAKVGKSVGEITGHHRLTDARVYKTFEELAEKSKPDVVLHTAGSKAEAAIGQIKPMAERGVSVVSSCEELLVPKFRAPKLADVRVHKSFEELAGKNKPQVVLHTAGSKADAAIEQIKPMAQQGVSVVSSCEELLVPSFRAPALSKELDEVCKANNARVLGTGVNPGFVMDVLPVCMTGVSRSVEHIYCERVVNAATRRQPLQKKIGSGLDPDEMRRLFKDGKAGHAGFLESLALVGHAMNWTFTETYELFEPMIAPYDI